ncbi:hypothetical protein PG994_012038 [Apiospora phragmitis]|uniref:LysM domain-containing protein n=1 Tax=Apiospora phragmitis TaxID=2905665 RepID=A0ABR1TUJ9_9PEZI
MVLLLLPALLLVHVVQSRHLVSRDCTFSVTAEPGDTCASLADYWGITLADFQSYNAGVDCSSALKAGTDYCVERDDGQPPTTTTTTSSKTTTATTTTTPSGPSPTQTGIASDCKAFYKAVSGDTCQKIVDKFGNFTLASLPISRFTGNSYYLVQSGDYCQKIVDKYSGKFTLGQFYTWNPAVGSDCAMLFIGYYVCVGIKS